MAKGMGGGLPLGAILGIKELECVWSAGNHGTTYGGNALACATGLVVLQELENGLLQNVIETGDYLYTELEKVKADFPDLILEVRGLGLMRGLLLSFDALELVKKLIDKGVITNAASGTVLRLVPPLIINKADVDEFISILRICLKD
jgi:acetylornithine/succinyldiaminopimelate/putrescine aminotransferase